MKEKLGILLLFITWVVFSFGLSYLIHFELHFFGATFITLKDIIGLWVGFPMFTGALCIIFYIESKK